MTDTESSYEQDNDSTTELHAPRRPRKGGKHVREELTSLTQFLRHMKNHYWAQAHVCKGTIKFLRARLRRALKRCKGHDRLQILAKAYLIEHDT